MFKLKCIIVTLVLMMLVSINSAWADVVVIINNENQVTLSKKDISRIFLGKLKTYSTGNSIKPINAGHQDNLRNAFNRKVLNKSSNQVKAYWSKLIFSGKGTMPKELSSDAEIKAFIAGNPDAIGYIDSNNLDKSVKVILTL